MFLILYGCPMKLVSSEVKLVLVEFDFGFDWTKYEFS